MRAITATRTNWNTACGLTVFNDGYCLTVVDHTVFTCGKVDSKWNAILAVLILKGRLRGRVGRECKESCYWGLGDCTEMESLRGVMCLWTCLASFARITWPLLYFSPSLASVCVCVHVCVYIIMCLCVRVCAWSLSYTGARQLCAEIPYQRGPDRFHPEQLVTWNTESWRFDGIVYPPL